VSVVCCQVEVSATGRSLAQRSPTECGVSECDRGTSNMRRSWLTGGLSCQEKNSVCDKFVRQDFKVLYRYSNWYWFTYEQYFKYVCIAVNNLDTKLDVSYYTNPIIIVIEPTDN
jgi:hypothetical protein